MSQKFATIFFTRLYILDFLNKKQQISVTSELLPISSYVTDIYYLFLFELFLIITMYQVTDIYYYFKLLQISVTLDLISNSYKVTDTQQPIYLIACHALPLDIQCHFSCMNIVLKVPKCLFIGGSTQIFMKIMEISHRNRKNNFHATFMTLKNRNKNDIGQVCAMEQMLSINI